MCLAYSQLVSPLAHLLLPTDDITFMMERISGLGPCDNGGVQELRGYLGSGRVSGEQVGGVHPCQSPQGFYS